MMFLILLLLLSGIGVFILEPAFLGEYTLIVSIGLSTLSVIIFIIYLQVKLFFGWVKLVSYGIVIGLILGAIYYILTVIQ